MKRRFYTIFILPHAHARFRQLHLSRNFVLTLVGIAAVALLGGALAPHLILKVRQQGLELAAAQDHNQKLREDNEKAIAALDAMESRMTALETRAVRLAQAVGLDKVPGSPATGGAPPVGGSANLATETADVLSSRLQDLDLTFQAIDGAWGERSKILSHTPSGMPVEGFFSDGYGWRKDPFTGQREFHKGLDIVAPHGTAVQAPADGLVVKAGRVAGYGHMVQVAHGFGLTTLYAHLSKVLVRPGQRIRRGEALGKVGSTGRSTGPHLHYEVFREGRQVNPRPFVGDRVF